ncbi:MAG: DUF1002 domain-containing protein [Lactobacillus crispatus]|nr:DUF1002 domain-containing protein [Lactobacillus crispatus]MCT7802571.1 DUF1002 domain-containing protein [Lactobacillus crispatus]MCT7807737.1 DUF1002 domain-containing protein [Lactobacillus crispatus]MCT7816119.1 DUF1002 domain-containing protein [Lactobacillus crispatus]
MKLTKYIFLLTSFVAFIFAFFNLSSTQVKADNISNIPSVAIGSSLTKQQRQQTIQTLTQPLNGSNYQVVNVNGNDLVKFLNPTGDNFTVSSRVWSSVMIQKTNSNGIKVQILPYQGKNNITTITADQYTNAALTAGIKNCNIYVTSAIPIDGSGALAGVYKALEEQGTDLDQKRIDAAQDEMNTLSGINKENKGKTGYSDSQLNRAIAGSKKDMAKQGQNITNSKIEKIVNNQININHLGNTINNNQKMDIIKLLENIRDSGALKDGNFQDGANSLVKNISKDAHNLVSQSKSVQGQGNWINHLANLLTKLFNNLKIIFQTHSNDLK